MTQGRAHEIAHELYGGNVATESLLLQAIHGVSADERRRAANALRALDPDEPAPGPAEDIALAVARVLVRALYGKDRPARQRLSNLLGAVCREAA
jgi:hypothetical protein